MTAVKSETASDLFTVNAISPYMDSALLLSMATGANTDTVVRGLL